MSEDKILDEEPAPLPGKRKSDAHEVNPSCKTLKKQPLTTLDGEIHVNGTDGGAPEREGGNGGGKVESLPENGRVEEEDGRASAENEEDDDDDEDYDEKKEKTEGIEEVVDRKGKGIMAEGERDDKGKSVISWDDYEFDSDISLDCEDDDSDSDSDDTELPEMESDGDLSDDPLAEVDLENILPSRTRNGSAGTRGVFILGGDRKDARDGDVDLDRNGDDRAYHLGDGNADHTSDAGDDHTGDGDNKGL